MSGTLILLTIANIANSTRQSTPKLITSDGSSFACRSKRHSPDMATLLWIEDVPTLAPPMKDECDTAHNAGAFGPGTVCTRCGIIGADARPNWLEKSERESLTGVQW
jgi:hypothetical protein